MTRDIQHLPSLHNIGTDNVNKTLSTKYLPFIPNIVTQLCTSIFAVYTKIGTSTSMFVSNWEGSTKREILIGMKNTAGV